MSGTLTWEQFLKQANEFIKLSEKFEDNWQLVQKAPSEGQTYLGYKQMISAELKSKNDDLEKLAETFKTSDPATTVKKVGKLKEEILSLEYHVIYSISYQVPVLYFKGHKSDGTSMNLEDSWKLFSDSMSTETSDNLKSKMLSILTQMDHPILFRPYLALHPCKTSELLQNTRSKNLIVTFLSLIGPFVKLNLKPEYGVHFNE